MSRPRTLTLIGMILMAALTRVIPHPWNFTPVAAMALFAGANFSDRRLAFSVPFLSLLLSDVVLGFHRTMPFVYGAFAITVLIGMRLRERRDMTSVAGASLVSSLLFFLITNFGYWITTAGFPKSFAGAVACYTAAIPFFRGTAMGDLLFSAAMFGSFRLAEKSIPALRPSIA